VFQAAAWAMIGFNPVELLTDLAFGDFHIITVLEIHPKLREVCVSQVQGLMDEQIDFPRILHIGPTGREQLSYILLQT
jgi:hypothetical protein